MEPLVVTATAAGSRTQSSKAAMQPPVVDGGTIQFAPDTITARAPDPTPWSLLQPAPPQREGDVVALPPDTIYARAPEGKPGIPDQPLASSKAGVPEFAPETLYGNAPGATRTTPPGPHQEEKQAQRAANEVEATETQDETEREARKTESEAETGKDLQQPAAATVTDAGEKERPRATAAGGDVSGLAEWRARVKGATAAAPRPTLGKTPAAGITVIYTTGRGNSARRRGAGAGLVDDAKKAVRKPPETPKQLPAPPPTPVPAADQLVTAASDKKLPKQTLPVLQTRPGGSVPTMDIELAADIGTTLSVPAPEPSAAPAADKQPLDSKQVKKLKDAKAKQPAAPKTAKAGQTMVLEDTAPPPTPGIEVGTRGQSKEKVAQVLAELLRSPELEAAKIVTEARTEAYPRAALQREYPELGRKEKETEVLAELKAQVESIRVIAGISVQELDAAIATRNETLKKMQGNAVAAIDKARDESKDETKTGGTELADKIAGARQAVDEHTIQQLIAARGEADPEVIALRRDKGLTDITRRAARQDVYYEKSGERRDKALDAASVRMNNAYKNAAKHDQEQIYKELLKTATKGLKAKDVKLKEAAATQSRAQAELQAKPFFEWAATHTLELKRQFSALRSEAAAVVKRYRDGIKGALARAKDMIREWAEAKIAAQESWWDYLMRKFREWVKDAQDDSAAWEEARNEGLRDSLVADLNMLDDIHAAGRSGVNVGTYVQERGLDQAQAAILQTYFGGEKGKPRDAIGAVAVGMRMRVRGTRKPAVIEYFKSTVMALPDTEWRILGRIGNAERPPFDVVALASDLHAAMDQWGTDEGKIYQALANLTPLQARAIRARYVTRYGISLDDHLASELSGAEQTRADALLAGNQTLADVATLYEAMHGGLTGAGTDEDAIMRVLRNKTAEEREAIAAEYRKRYGTDLNTDLKSELDDGWSSHHDYDRATALMEGNTAKADAIAVDQTMHGGITGAGTAEKELYAVFEQTRAEVEAEAASKGWSTKQVEQEVRRRNDRIEQEYEKKYGDPNWKPGSGKSAMRKAFESELSDEELDLANALADNDVMAADAARLEIEKNSFITGDEAVNNILESQYKRARREVERDVNVDLQFRAEVDALRDKPWKREDWERERKAAGEKIDKDSRERGKRYMSDLENAYDSKYSKFGKGGLQVLIAFGMTGTDRQKAYDLIEGGGYVEPEQEIFYAVEGAGTDVDALKRVLKKKSPAQVDKIRKAWNKRYGEDPGFDERIKDEVSGRDLQDMEWALQGEPQTMEGKLQRAKERMDYEENAYGVLGTREAELSDIKEQYAALEAEKAHLERMEGLKGDKRPGESEEDYLARTEEYAYWEDSFNLQHSYFDRSVEDHRKAVDKLADMAATIAAIVATVLVVVVVTIATGGTAAALFAALASAKVAAAMALTAAAATIVTKQLIKGSTYTGGEMLVDVAVGIVDTAASVLTAGVGGALLKTARAGAPVSRIAAMAAKTRAATGLAKMAASERVATRVFANALAEGMEGVASTLPSALVGNALKEENWAKGNPLTNILTGTLVETSIGAGLGGGLGGLGGLGKHADDIADTLPSGRKALAGEFAETGDVLARRGAPSDRLALWKGWQVENPGRPYQDFLQEFDAGLIAKEADESAVRAVQRELRSELLSGIPPAERKLFADVPIHVMSDADFERFTRSATGQAVVIFEDGKPRVILREGADPKALREEGIHLLQSRDPRFAKKFAALDESRLANWKNLDLDEQLGLYRTKLDIEMDAQQRLLKSLDDQLASVDDPALRKSLQARREAALTNFENLKNRLDEVAGISPTERLKMARGEIDVPQYLDQKPRLFSKSADDVARDAEFADALAHRRLEAKQLKEAIVGVLTGPETKKLSPEAQRLVKQFKVVWTKYGNRVRAYASDFAAYVKQPDFDATKLYDVATGLVSFLKVAKGIADTRQLDKFGELLAGTARLFEIKGLSLRYIDRFVQLVPHFEKPAKLLDLVGDLASLNSFRRKSLPSVADVLEAIAKGSHEGPRLAAEFSDELSELATKTRFRDAIDKGKRPTEWAAAQEALEEAAEALKSKAGRFNLEDAQLSPILEEFARSGRFNWKVFKETLTEAHPLEHEKFKQLKSVIEEIKEGIAAGKREWVDTDVGPILHWRDVVERLHSSLDEAGQTQLIKNLKEELEKLLPDLTVYKYGKYRELVKNEVIGHVMAAGSPAQQLERFKELMEFLRAPPKKDSATIGEYFAAFRRKIFEKGKPHLIQGELAGAFDIDGASRKLDGAKRMVDGAIEVQKAVDPPRGPSKPGRYLVEDKAGESFDLAQAEFYSKQLEANEGKGVLKTADPEEAHGVIYFAEDPIHALKIASALADRDPPLHANLVVATFGPDNTIRFVPRPTKPQPRVSKSRKK